MAALTNRRHFVSLGMFIIDQFAYLDEDGNPTGRTLPAQVSARYLVRPGLALRKVQIGGGGTYANIGARIWFACY